MTRSSALLAGIMLSASSTSLLGVLSPGLAEPPGPKEAMAPEKKRSEPTKSEPPKAEPTKAEPPKAEPPKAEPPKAFLIGRYDYAYYRLNSDPLPGDPDIPRVRTLAPSPNPSQPQVAPLPDATKAADERPASSPNASGPRPLRFESTRAFGSSRCRSVG